MIDENFAQLLLTNIPGAKLASGNKEVRFRCKYCGDSVNPTSAHFYVCLGDNDEPFYYHCFKCHVKGVVNRPTLLDWGIFDIDGITNVVARNREVMKLTKNVKFNDEYIYNIVNNYYTDHPITYKKLEYVNRRLGTNLTIRDAMDLKIVFNMKDLAQYNTIRGPKDDREAKYIEELNLSFIGFLTHDNAYLSLRNVREGKSFITKRWVKYNLVDKYSNNKSYYILPTRINLCSPERIKINIAEGQFDILSIYLNLKNREPGIYACISGSGYMKLCNYLIDTLGYFYSEVHIYKDQDINWNIIRKVAAKLKKLNIPIYMHENMMAGEKDFGVPLDRIIDNMIKYQ